MAGDRRRAESARGCKSREDVGRNLPDGYRARHRQQSRPDPIRLRDVMGVYAPRRQADHQRAERNRRG